MKGLFRWTLVLVIACGTMAHAQNVAGTWQGTLRAGNDLRIVFVISTAEAGELRAVMHSIDQPVPPLTATVAHKGSTLRMTIAVLGATYEGNLSADGSSIAGTFTQAGKSLPLSLTRATAETAWPLPAPPKPMAADAPMAFEVASIKPSNPDRPGKLFTVKGRQVITINTTANDLITFAYELHARQLVGGPPWMESDKYDVTGQPEGQGLPDMKQLRALMRQLLTDRFKLSFHREKRELPVYAITVVSGGPKLTKNETNPNGLPGLLFRGLGVLPGVNATIADLAGVMQTAVLDRPVVDRTGLQGRYDFTLTWTPDETQFTSMGVRVPPPSNDPNAPPNLFTAFQEQLGLKLDATRAPAEVLVIDRIDKPSEN
jgi:bla regulator protein blaR1